MAACSKKRHDQVFFLVLSKIKQSSWNLKVFRETKWANFLGRKTACRKKGTLSGFSFLICRENQTKQLSKRLWDIFDETKWTDFLERKTWTMETWKAEYIRKINNETRSKRKENQSRCSTKDCEKSNSVACERENIHQWRATLVCWPDLLWNCQRKRTPTESPWISCNPEQNSEWRETGIWNQSRSKMKSSGTTWKGARAPRRPGPTPFLIEIPNRSVNTTCNTLKYIYRNTAITSRRRYGRAPDGNPKRRLAASVPNAWKTTLQSNRGWHSISCLAFARWKNNYSTLTVSPSIESLAKEPKRGNMPPVFTRYKQLSAAALFITS